MSNDQYSGEGSLWWRRGGGAGASTVTGAESVEKAETTLKKSTFLANFFSAFLLL